MVANPQSIPSDADAWPEELIAAQAERAAPFNPASHAINLEGRNGRGGRYLEVKWRLVWLRAEHPDADIVTDLVRLEERDAIFKATVSIPGGGSATGYGSESAGDFRDFLEKAETKAIGRALAALGYGTQFCEDHATGVSQATGKARIVDAGVDFARPNAAPARPAGQPGNGNGNDERERVRERDRDLYGDEAPRSVAPANAGAEATEKQHKMVWALVREKGVVTEAVDGEALSDLEFTIQTLTRGKTELSALTRREMSELITHLQARPNVVAR